MLPWRLLRMALMQALRSYQGFHQGGNLNDCCTYWGQGWCLDVRGRGGIASVVYLKWVKRSNTLGRECHLTTVSGRKPNILVFFFLIYDLISQLDTLPLK